MSSLSSNCVGFQCIVDRALLLCNQSIHATANSITPFFSLFLFFGGCVGKIIMCLVLIFGRVNLDNFWDGVGSVVICSGY
jgi:FtsH-binding integral membrane protein